MLVNNENKTRRIKGLIYGTALGDAVGGYLEFRTRNAILRDYPTPSDYTFPPPIEKQVVCKRDTKCLWTDDTNQMLCIIRSLHRTENVVSIQDFAGELYDWLENGFPEIGQNSGEGCGGTTFSVIKHPLFKTDPYRASLGILNNKRSSNGSIMRTAIMGARPGDKYQVIQDSICFGSTTHNEFRCNLGCHVITSIIYDILHDVDDTTIIQNLYGIVPESYQSYLTIHHLEELILDDTHMGYSLKCMAVGVWAFRQRHRGYKPVILDIILQGGDADTNAAVAGAILGTYYGYNQLPQEWLVNLRHKEFLDQHYSKFMETISC